MIPVVVHSDDPWIPYPEVDIGFHTTYEGLVQTLQRVEAMTDEEIDALRRNILWRRERFDNFQAEVSFQIFFFSAKIIPLFKYMFQKLNI